MEFQLKAESFGGQVTTVDVVIDIAEFDRSMDAIAVKELLDIIVCDDYLVTDVDEEDLYAVAEKIYQALQAT